MHLRRSGLMAALMAAAGLLVPMAARAQYATTAPDFTKLGFPNVVASANIAAGASGSVQYGPITVNVPQGALPDAVRFELLEAPTSSFQAKAPKGETVVADFALRIVDQTTGLLVPTLLKPATFTLTSSSVNSASVYDNVTTTGQIVPNAVPATITGDVLAHPVPAALAGWVVLSPKTAPAATSAPDFTQHGFSSVVATTNLGAGAAGTLHYGPITVAIPAGTFPAAVKFELLTAAPASIQVPAGQSLVSALAFKVVDTATGQLITKFTKPIQVTVQSPAVTSASAGFSVGANGSLTASSGTSVSGHTMTRSISNASSGFAVTRPASTVPGATTPSTGVPILPIVGLGALLIGIGGVLLRHARQGA